MICHGRNFILAACGAAAILFSPPAFAGCYERASDGTCLDESTPATGQYSNADDQAGATKVTNLRASQAHANVRLTEATYVFAHNICRWVDNPQSHGSAIFVGLEAKSEWTSFIASPPAGVDLQYCCQPATVSICGSAVKIPFGVAGKSYAFSGGYDFKATYSCGANLSGIAPTVDTSWKVATSGSCDQPQPACQSHGGDKGDSCADASGDDHDHGQGAGGGGHHGPGGGGSGDGGDAGG